MSRDFSGFVFINVYDVNRACGGPEEGGWWFDYGECKKCRPVKGSSEALRIQHRWQRYLDHAYNDVEGARSDLGSVLCEGRMVAYIQSHPGSDFPEERPRYE